MRGIITGRDVLSHPLIIMRFWGPAAYVRCLRALVWRRSSTFLDVVLARRATGAHRAKG